MSAFSPPQTKLSEYKAELKNLMETSPINQRQCTDLLKTMKVEVRMGEYDKVFENKFIEEKKKEIDLLVITGNRQTLGLSDNSHGETLTGGAADKSRLETTNEKLNKSNEVLQQTMNQLAELEETGLEITTNLQSNRELIEKTQEKTKGVTAMTQQANEMVKRMSKFWA